MLLGPFSRPYLYPPFYFLVHGLVNRGRMASTNLAAKNVPVYQPRSYQLEMFEASMKENIIVAVCGHTQVMECE